MSTVLAKPSEALTESSGSSDNDSIKGKGAYSATESAAEVPALGTPVADGPKSSFWRKSKHELDSIATQPSVYRPPPTWENTHRFDPLARWTWREEYRLVRKIDCLIAAWACVMFFSLDLDRSNISQANTDNFLKDLGLTTDDFNLGNTLFRLSFLIAEMPSQIISKRVGPDVWIPTQMILWSFVSLGQFWLTGRKSFLATRFLLGFMQGGFIPDTVLYLSYFYTKNELPVRLAWFWVSNYIAEICGAFIATGLLRLRGGGLTLLVGIISFFMMPPGPTQTKAWYRPKGWFSEREEVIMVNRVIRDDPSKSDMHNREGLSPKKFWQVLLDWRIWPVYILGLIHFIPVTPPQLYLTLSLRNLGFTTTQSNLLSIPSKVIGMIMLLATSYLSEIINSRTIATVFLQFWALPLLIALYTFDEQTSQWAYYAVVTLITGFPYIHPIQVAWASTNSSSVGTRTLSASMYNMFVQAGLIIGVHKRGNRALIVVCCVNILIHFLVWLFYRTINKRRDKVWNSWTAKEQQEYLDTTKDVGNSRINFRFVY
ncbi:MFS general substrate transporter [Epithele typhae]|uniref:MFS general substrate transporter n=1 Tax=Epithele typhae TaxID=378194 RepID=UPI0020088535|nr:MFS general substrate transporter [Epithele typhae]KAH9931993.1 MFS general substrate transporter [Epithele typhae]